jgi:hypothetical protein
MGGSADLGDESISGTVNQYNGTLKDNDNLTVNKAMGV